MVWRKQPIEKKGGATLLNALSLGSAVETNCVQANADLQLTGDFPKVAHGWCGIMLRIGVSEISPGVVTGMTISMLDLEAMHSDFLWQRERDKAFEQDKVDRLRRDATSAPKL